MIVITCDRCGTRIPTDEMNNRVQLVKWRADGEGSDTPSKALTPTFDLCDRCERTLANQVIGWAQETEPQ